MTERCRQVRDIRREQMNSPRSFRLKPADELEVRRFPWSDRRVRRSGRYSPLQERDVSASHKSMYYMKQSGTAYVKLTSLCFLGSTETFYVIGVRRVVTVSVFDNICSLRFVANYINMYMKYPSENTG